MGRAWGSRNLAKLFLFIVHDFGTITLVGSYQSVVLEAD